MDNQTGSTEFVTAGPLVEEGPVRVRRGRHGPMLYLSSDQYVGRSLERYGEYSEGEIALFRQLAKPGHVIIDAGANIGVHTVFLAKAVRPGGMVVAFEPQRIIFQMLCGNVALNALSNVHVYQAALGEAPGRATVPTVDYGEPGNFGGLALEDGGRGESVNVTTIDTLALRACHLMKIDVEGMERAVLAGAAETIRRHKPALYVENDRREKSAALIEYLLGLDYRLFWHLPALFNARNFAGETENVFGRIVSVNMLAVPRDGKIKPTGMREITSPEADWRQPERAGATA